MKKRIALLLAVVLLIGCLAGCSSTEKKMVGVWRYSGIELEGIARELALQLGFSEEDLSYMDINGLPPYILRTFYPDGTYALSWDREQAEYNLGVMFDALAEKAWEEFSKQIGQDIPLDRVRPMLAKILGWDTYDAARNRFIKVGLESMEKLNISENGTYSVKGKTVTFTPTEGETYTRTVKVDTKAGILYLSTKEKEDQYLLDRQATAELTA